MCQVHFRKSAYTELWMNVHTLTSLSLSQPSECEQCTCDIDGIARCLVADCAPPPCVNPVYEKGHCCPTCKDGERIAYITMPDVQLSCGMGVLISCAWLVKGFCRKRGGKGRWGWAAYKTVGTSALKSSWRDWHGLWYSPLTERKSSPWLNQRILPPTPGSCCKESSFSRWLETFVFIWRTWGHRH